MLGNLDEGSKGYVIWMKVYSHLCGLNSSHQRSVSLSILAWRKRNVTISTAFITLYFYFSGDKFSWDDNSVRRVMGLRLVKEIELLQEPLVFLIVILSQPSESFTSSCYPEKKTFIISIYRLWSGYFKFLRMLSDLQMSQLMLAGLVFIRPHVNKILLQIPDLDRLHGYPDLRGAEVMRVSLD